MRLIIEVIRRSLHLNTSGSVYLFDARDFAVTGTDLITKRLNKIFKFCELYVVRSTERHSATVTNM